MHYRKAWASPQCSLCEVEQESLEHLFVCSALSDSRTEAILIIEKLMDTVDSHPGIKAIMIPTIFY